MNTMVLFSDGYYSCFTSESSLFCHSGFGEFMLLGATAMPGTPFLVDTHISSNGIREWGLVSTHPDSMEAA